MSTCKDLLLNPKELIPNEEEKTHFINWLQTNKLSLPPNNNNQSFPRFAKCISRIVYVTPKDMENYDEFMERIRHSYRKMFYLAPEISREGWDFLCTVLGQYIPNPTEEWQINIATLVTEDK